MKEERRTKRRAQIEDAAYEVLAGRGFAGTTMLEVAKRARASNETLYQWYGSKTGLFLAMIERNRAEAAQALSVSTDGESLASHLEEFGAALLWGILSDRAILLNRAAAADPSGELAQALVKGGRDSILPLLVERLNCEPVAPGFCDHGDMAECFIALLVSDLQIRRLTGAIPAPGRDECAERARQSVRRFLRLARADALPANRG